MTSWVSSTRGRLVLTLLALAALASVALVHVPTAQGAFIAKVTNSTNTAATNAFFTCSSTVDATYSKTQALFAYPLNEASGTTAKDASGSANPGAYTSTGVTYGASPGGLCSRDSVQRVITLDGTAGYVVADQADAATASPSVFTEMVWFKTSVKQGKLIGVEASNKLDGTTGGQYDRHIYLTSAGLLTFGVYNGGYQTITSPVPATSTSNYADNTWHFVAASMSSTGMKLYVDGAQVGTNSNAAGESTSTWWHIGFGNLSGWPGAPTSNFFKGSLAYASVYTSELTANQIKARYIAGKP